MDPRLLLYYNRELQHLREVGGEFAKEFPKIAGRLGLESFECADPYVERLLEGFAFLAARVQLKIDAEFPVFTQHLLDMVYPHYLAPVPSLAVVQFQPDPTEGSLAAGVPVPRGTALRSQLGAGEQTPCEYRTGHDVTLWPLQLTQAAYFTRDVPTIDIPDLPGVKAGFHLRLQTTAGVPFPKLPLDRLPLFIRGSGRVPMRIYELLLANTRAVVVRPAQRPAPWEHVLDRSQLVRVGFDAEQALLPADPRAFQGYRLLQEYFALPDRFLFVEFRGLGPAVRRCADAELDVIVLLDRTDSGLERAVDVGNFALFSTPAVNLFPKRTDRLHLNARQAEYHVVPDRSRPLDFEVCQVAHAVAYGTSADEQQDFLPFYAIQDESGAKPDQAYFVIRRVPRVLSERERRQGPRSSYVGTESFVSLVDAQAAPFSTALKQMELSTLCTNRDLPLHMPVGKGRTDFTVAVGLPIQAVRCLAGPTSPKPSAVCVPGATVWRLVNHLALNYATLLDHDARQGAAALRQLLKLYGDISEPTMQKQVEGVRSVASVPVVRRAPRPGPIAFARGLQVTVTFDESAFEGTGAFLLGAVLEEFFAQFVSLNCFTETTVQTVERGEIMRWPVRIGRRQLL